MVVLIRYGRARYSASTSSSSSATADSGAVVIQPKAMHDQLERILPPGLAAVEFGVVPLRATAPAPPVEVRAAGAADGGGAVGAPAPFLRAKAS